MPRPRASNARLQVVEEMPARKNAQPQRPSSLTIEGPLIHAAIGLLATLIGTGIVSMVNLSSHVATLTENQLRTEQTLQRHLDHAVDKDEYLRRDQQIQRALDNMATKDDIHTLRAMILDALEGNPKAEKYRADARR